MALYDFVRAITKSALMVHLKNIPKDVYRWRKDLLDAVVTKEELNDWMIQGGVDHGNLTGLSDDDHTQYLLAAGTRALTGNWDAGSFEIRAQTLESDVTTGTAPLTIASTTKVDNLNADLLDDQTGSYYLDHGNHTGLLDDDHTQYVLRSQWLQNGFVDEAEFTISWSDANRTLTLAKVGASFRYFHDGILYTSTANKTKQIDDTEGLWVFYIDGETLTAANSPSEEDIDGVIENECIVAYVYWDATNNLGKLFSEPHGYKMSPATHHYLHDNFGAQYLSGMALADILADENGSSNTHVQFSTAAGKFYDEDVEVDTEATASNVGLEIYYFNGSDLRWTTNAGYSFINGGTGRIMYNNAGAQAEVGNTKFVLAHVFATNIKDSDGTDGRLIAIQGQAQYDTLTAARDGADTEIGGLITGDLPMEEIIPVATVIFQTADSYTNDVNARIRSTTTGDDYVDWRTVSLSGGSSSLTDHGLLSGLADDDHTQYLLADGTRGLSADWDAGTWEIRANTFESDVATGTIPLVIASTTKCTNLNADQLDGLHDTAFVKANGTVALSAAWDAGSYEIRSLKFYSDQATGTAPLTIASTTVCTNLNADKVDGYDGSAFLQLAGGTMAGDIVVGPGVGAITVGSGDAILIENDGALYCQSTGIAGSIWYNNGDNTVDLGNEGSHDIYLYSKDYLTADGSFTFRVGDVATDELTLIDATTGVISQHDSAYFVTENRAEAPEFRGREWRTTASDTGLANDTNSILVRWDSSTTESVCLTIPYKVHVSYTISAVTYYAVEGGIITFVAVNVGGTTTRSAAKVAGTSVNTGAGTLTVTTTTGGGTNWGQVYVKAAITGVGTAFVGGHCEYHVINSDTSNTALSTWAT